MTPELWCSCELSDLPFCIEGMVSGKMLKLQIPFRVHFACRQLSFLLLCWWCLSSRLLCLSALQGDYGSCQSMADVFSDLYKAVTALFQARSKRPFIFLEVPSFVIVTAREGSGRKGKGRS